MRILLLLTLLSGCANIQDNTTLSDKAIIGTTLTTMIVLAANIQEINMKIKVEIEIDTESEHDSDLLEELLDILEKLKGTMS